MNVNEATIVELARKGSNRDQISKRLNLPPKIVARVLRRHSRMEGKWPHDLWTKK